MQQCVPPRAPQTSPTTSSNIAGSPVVPGAFSNGTSWHAPAEASTLPHPPLPQPQPQSLEATCRSLHTQIHTFLGEETKDSVLQSVQVQTRIALDVIAKTFDKFELEELCFSYNGGKDCLVLLVLYLVGLWERFGEQDGREEAAVNGKAVNGGHTTTEAASSTIITGEANTQATASRTSARQPTKQSSRRPFPTSLTSIYIQVSHPFPEVTSFVESSSACYHLDLVSSALPMKQAFEEYLNKHKDVKAIFVGTRRTDPHGGSLTFWDVTDRGWPNFTRIHPVIDWHYREIWAFIRHLQIPYCSLYDLGYTSLGGTTDTHPNPRLAAERASATSAEAAEAGMGTAETEIVRYRPAYELMEDEEERLGRDSR